MDYRKSEAIDSVIRQIKKSSKTGKSNISLFKYNLVKGDKLKTNEILMSAF